jgi:DNA-nicking Smr family endonuclease
VKPARPRERGGEPAHGGDDAALFRAEVRDVKPVTSANRAHLPRPLPPPIPAKRLEDERAVMKELAEHGPDLGEGTESGEELSYLRQGLPRDVLRKLKRGHWVLREQLDLHGHSTAEAMQALSQFLAECRRHGHRCVRIVHGKGLRSRNREPVLKNKVRVALARRSDVLAYAEAAPADGGSGAVIVLLEA